MSEIEISDQHCNGFSFLEITSWLNRGFRAGFLNRELDTRRCRSVWSNFSDKELLLLRQVHGTEIVDLTSDKNLAMLREKAVAADGWTVDFSLSTLKKYAFGIETADCAPVLITSSQSKIASLCHCGWRGSVAGLLSKTLEQMIAGVAVESIELVIGPSASVEKYEVGADVALQIENAWKIVCDARCAAVEKRGMKYFADISSLLVAQAKNRGVLPNHIKQIKRCTIADPHYFSYRRDPSEAGRQVSFIELAA